MITFNDVQNLASRAPRPDNCVLTLYLDTDESKQENLNRYFENHLKTLLANARRKIRREKERNAFECASRRIQEFIHKQQIRACTSVIVLDTFDGFFWTAQVRFPVADRLEWGRTVCVEPLIAAISQYKRFGIALLDRANLRLFSTSLGEIEELPGESFDHKKVRRTKTVGMDHLGAASHAQRRADEQVRLNLRSMAVRIAGVAATADIDYLILAGSPEVTHRILALLPKRLRDRVIGSVDVAINASLGEVRNLTAPIAEAFERKNEGNVVCELLTSAAKEGHVVLGKTATLEALNEGRIWRLVCADMSGRKGRIEKAVATALEVAARKGAAVEMISGQAKSSLISAGGLGGFLKTRAHVARVS